MASETDIANMALVLVGAERITDLALDTSERAIYCQLYYPQARDEALVVAAPNFALGRATLAQSDTAPPFGFTRSFPLPGDFLRLLGSNLEEDGQAWRLEGTAILTDESTVQIRYIRRVVLTGTYTPLFTQALVYNLASLLCFPLRKAREHAMELKGLFREVAYSSSTHDSQQGGTAGVSAFADSEFDLVRRFSD